MSGKERKKILFEFSLLPECKQELQEFFDRSLDALRQEDPSAKAELQYILHKVLPVEAQASLKEIFSGKSEYALLMHNLPESAYQGGLPPSNSAFTLHIGEAIYSMHGAELSRVRTLDREKGDADNPRVITGGHIHRDFPGTAHYAMLLARSNDEHAGTQVIDLLGALNEIPEKEREVTNVRVTRNAMHTFALMNTWHEVKSLTLEDVLSKLNAETHDAEAFVSKLQHLSPEKFESKFERVIKRHSATVDLQPGDLLIWDEAHLFHRALEGNVKRVSPTTTLTRLAIRTAGAPVAER